MHFLPEINYLLLLTKSLPLHNQTGGLQLCLYEFTCKKNYTRRLILKTLAAGDNFTALALKVGFGTPHGNPFRYFVGISVGFPKIQVITSLMHVLVNISNSLALSDVSMK